MDTEQVFEVLDRVKTWDADMRIDLARRILETVVPPRPLMPPMTIPLEEVFGIMKGVPAPSDEECKRIIKEERLKRYE